MFTVSLLCLFVCLIFLIWDSGCFKLCLGDLNVKWLFQVFLNLAVIRGQIPRWSHSDFTTSGHYFSSFQVSFHIPKHRQLMTDPEARARFWHSRAAPPICVVFVKLIPFAESSFLHPHSSVQFSRSVVSDSLLSHESQHARPPYPLPSPGVHSDSCPSSQWCHPAISSSVVAFSSSVVPFSSCPQSLPASESSPISQLFTWGGQSTGVSALASVLPMNTQDWSLGWTGWISLPSKGLSRVFSNTTVQKHQFFGAQLSL